MPYTFRSQELSQSFYDNLARLQYGLRQNNKLPAQLLWNMFTNLIIPILSLSSREMKPSITGSILYSWILSFLSLCNFFLSFPLYLLFHRERGSLLSKALIIYSYILSLSLSFCLTFFLYLSLSAFSAKDESSISGWDNLLAWILSFCLTSLSFCLSVPYRQERWSPLSRARILRSWRRWRRPRRGTPTSTHADRNNLFFVIKHKNNQYWQYAIKI